MSNINYAIIGFGGIAKTHALGTYMASLVNFANELFFNETNSITPTIKDALKAQRVIEAAYTSDKQVSIVTISSID